MNRVASALIAAIAWLATAVGPAAARPIHIVAFGDSTTAGWLVARQDAYPAQLQALLRKKGYDVVVTNAGINGGTFTDALLHFDAAIGPDTDIAIVEFGTNDLRQRVPLQDHARAAERISAPCASATSRCWSSALPASSSATSPAPRTWPTREWNLPPGKYRARDHAHYNAQGYAIVVARMLPQVEALIARVKKRADARERGCPLPGHGQRTQCRGDESHADIAHGVQVRRPRTRARRCRSRPPARYRAARC